MKKSSSDRQQYGDDEFLIGVTDLDGTLAAPNHVLNVLKSVTVGNCIWFAGKEFAVFLDNLIAFGVSNFTAEKSVYTAGF